jgi:hypothetical protein
VSSPTAWSIKYPFPRIMLPPGRAPACRGRQWVTSGDADPGGAHRGRSDCLGGGGSGSGAAAGAGVSGRLIRLPSGDVRPPMTQSRLPASAAGSVTGSSITTSVVCSATSGRASGGPG